MFNVLTKAILDLWQIPQFLVSASDPDDTDLPQSDGSPVTGDYNFRVDRFDCRTDPYGYYEDDL